MATAPKDGTAVLLLLRWRSEYECIVAKWEFRDLRSKSSSEAGAYWIGDGAIHTSGERSFVGWAPLPPMPPRTPWLRVGDRVRTTKYCREYTEPQAGVVDMAGFPSGSRWVYSVTLDSGEHVFLDECYLEREGDDEASSE